ncbi:MAG: adventurous gliding motility protein CglF [Myxococcota bacterium]
MRKLMMSVGMTVVFFTASAAVAQEKAPAPGVVYKKKTVFSFEDDTIDGDLTRPDGAYVESRKRIRHSNLIKIRDNFRDRILKSVSKI